MPELVELTSRERIERFLRRDPELQVYALGDLDPFFWPHTRWFALVGGDEPTAIVLLYSGDELPVILGFARDPDLPALTRLLAAVALRLPDRVYAHTTPGALAALGSEWSVDDRGRYLKLALANPDALAEVDTTGVERLGPEHLDELLVLYRESYPGNWFAPRMLETGQYFGWRTDQGELVSVAGVHVFSPAYRVAALGNVTTAPAWRGRGLALRTVARLCLSLREHVDTIGLNVGAKNHAAIGCYRRLGFVEVAPYDESLIRRAPAG